MMWSQKWSVPKVLSKLTKASNAKEPVNTFRTRFYSSTLLSKWKSLFSRIRWDWTSSVNSQMEQLKITVTLAKMPPPGDLNSAGGHQEAAVHFYTLHVCRGGFRKNLELNGDRMSFWHWSVVAGAHLEVARGHEGSSATTDWWEALSGSQNCPRFANVIPLISYWSYWSLLRCSNWVTDSVTFWACH